MGLLSIVLIVAKKRNEKDLNGKKILCKSLKKH